MVVICYTKSTHHRWWQLYDNYPSLSPKEKTECFITNQEKIQPIVLMTEEQFLLH